ncbi:hypothetical protein RJT34_03349 [Clitoria ternatea]|uniref:Uncharacterized protein n=1 Tax=Clitoria ternatea TaxID=43366 RepID=A0AAN9KJA3_CLITE
MDRDAFPPNQRSKRPNKMEIYLSSGAVSTISFPNHKLLAISASVISHCDVTYQMVMGGCLTLTLCDSQRAEIRVMKEYNVQSILTKLFVLPIYDVPHKSFTPICFSKIVDYRDLTMGD